jgi:hypothetical protein
MNVKKGKGKHCVFLKVYMNQGSMRFLNPSQISIAFKTGSVKNALVEWLLLLFVFGWSRFQISARIPAFVTKDFHGFPVSLQENFGIVPEIRSHSLQFITHT